MFGFPVGTIISVAWSFISGNWTKAAQLIVDWHKSTLDETATHEKTEADLASKDIDLQGRERDINAREQTVFASMRGGWLLLAPMGLIGWGVGLVYFKMLAIDKAFGPVVFYIVGCGVNSKKLCPDLDKLFSTDPLGVDLTSVALGVVGYYFGRALIGAGASIATSIASALSKK